MILDDIKLKYKGLPFWARALLMFITGLIPGIYYYLDEGQGFEDKLTEITTQETAARSEFENARQKKSDLPKLEEKLAFTEEQLNKAKRLLPDRYIIEDILEKTASIALKTNILLERFKPLNEIGHESEGYRYVELPIETQVTGEYQNIATFFDRIAHLETTIFIRNITITPSSTNPTRTSERPQNPTDFGLPGSSLLPSNPLQSNPGPLSPGELNQRINQRLTNNRNGEDNDGGVPPANRPQTPPQPTVNWASAENNAPFNVSAKFNLVIYRSLADNETVSTDPNSPIPIKRPEPPPPPATPPPPASTPPPPAA